MWAHKKFGKKEFKSKLARSYWGSSCFILTWRDPAKPKKGLTLAFKSWQAAKADGWVKIG